MTIPNLRWWIAGLFGAGLLDSIGKLIELPKLVSRRQTKIRGYRGR
jgi:hypothetical protein